MNKDDLMKKLKALSGNCAPADKNVFMSKIKNIKNLLTRFDNDYDFTMLYAVVGNLISKFPSKGSALEKIDAIYKEIETSSLKSSERYIAENIHKIEDQGREKNRRKKHIGLWIFIGAICFFSVAAIICIGWNILLAFKGIKPNDEKTSNILDLLSSIFGFVDFILGAIGFVWERITDVQGERLKEKAAFVEKVKNGNGTEEDLKSATDEFVTAYKKCVKVVQVGLINKVTLQL